MLIKQTFYHSLLLRQVFKKMTARDIIPEKGQNYFPLEENFIFLYT